MKKYNLLVSGIGISLGLLLFAQPVLAQEDVASLKKQIEVLKARVEALESTKAKQSQPQQMNQNPSVASASWVRRNPWDPFAEMEWIQDEMNRMFQYSFSRRNSLQGNVFKDPMKLSEGLNIKETKQGYEVTFNMKGLDKNKVDLEIHDQSLTVKGEKSSQDVEQNKNGYFRAQSFGSFVKTIPLPEDADTKNVKTERKGDTLIVKLPKKKV